MSLGLILDVGKAHSVKGGSLHGAFVGNWWTQLPQIQLRKTMTEEKYANVPFFRPSCSQSFC